MNDLEIKIFIPDSEAKKWLVFQEHYDFFNLLIERGVHEQKSASVSLHFDHLGVLQNIQRADFLYSKKHEG